MTIRSIEPWRFSDRYVDSAIEAEITRQHDWITEWFGERCPDVEPNCFICRLWSAHDAFAKAARDEPMEQTEDTP